MLSDQQIKEDLERLKDIAIATKAKGSEYETHTENVMGVELEVFSNIPPNLGKYYALANDFEDECFLVYQDERLTFGECLTLSRRFARALVEKYNIKKRRPRSHLRAQFPRMVSRLHGDYANRRDCRADEFLVARA